MGKTIDLCLTLAKGKASAPIIDELSCRFYEYIIRGSKLFSTTMVKCFDHMQCGCGEWLAESSAVYLTEINSQRCFHNTLSLHKFVCHRSEVSRAELDFVKSLPAATIQAIPCYMVRCPIDGNRNKIFYDYVIGYSAPVISTAPAVPFSAAPTVPATKSDSFKPVKRPRPNSSPPIAMIPSSPFKPIPRVPAPAPSVPSAPFALKFGSTIGQTREQIAAVVAGAGKPFAREIFLNNAKMVVSIRFKGFGFQYLGDDNNWHNFKPVFLVTK